MIIFEGKSPKPVYLLIQDDTAQLLDAGWLWGKSVWETEPAIKAKHQDPQIRVSSIGRAGETGCMRERRAVENVSAWSTYFIC